MLWTSFVIYFLLFSFAGWILDSTFCSITKRKFINSGYFHELPLCPLYGFGGLVLFFTTKYFSPFPWYIPVIISGVALNLVEYVGGIFCVLVLKERLWDYSNKKWNLHGHIDLFHSLCWIILAGLFYFDVFPRFLLFDATLQKTLQIPLPVDRTITILFVIIGIVLTFHRRKKRLAKKSGILSSYAYRRHHRRNHRSMHRTFYHRKRS